MAFASTYQLATRIVTKLVICVTPHHTLIEAPNNKKALTKLKKCQIHEQNHTKSIAWKLNSHALTEPQMSKKNLLDVKSRCIKLSQNRGREYGGTSRNQMANPKVATKPRKWFLTYCSPASTIPETKREKTRCQIPKH